MRWEAIRVELDKADRSFLDIGCNDGQLTEAVADLGVMSFGFEANREIAERAAIRLAGAERVAIMNHALTPETVGDLPLFDVVACLSVHHQWHVTYGATLARELLCSVARLAKRKMFFEVATIRTKYGEEPPEGLIDLDQASIDAYTRWLFEPVAREPRFLVNSPGLDREKFRSLYVIGPS